MNNDIESKEIDPINLVIKTLRDDNDLTFPQIADRVNELFHDTLSDPLTPDAVRGRYRRLPKDVSGLVVAPMDGIEKEYAGSDVDGLEEETLIEKTMQEANLDPDVWDIIGADVSTWGTPVRMDDGTTAIEKNWSVKLKLKALGAALTPENLLRRIKEMAPAKESISRSPQKNTGRLFVPSIYDAHLEKTAHDKDEDITSVYLNCLYQLIAEAGEFDKSLLVIGNDLGNVDNINMATTAGTPTENKYDFYQGSEYRCALMITAIDTLLEHGPVTVMVVPGNHDRQTSFWLGIVIKAYYHNNEDVDVINTPSDVEFYRWGNTMFMFAHGDKVNPDRLVGFLATQQKEMFAECLYREVFMGHLHVYRRMAIELQDKYGVLLRFMPGLSVTDTWHRKHLFVGSRRGAIGLVYDRENGWIREFPAFV